MIDYADRLYSLPKRQIGLDSLRKLVGSNDYAETVAIINKLEGEGILKCVKSSGTNGMNPPLYMKYTIKAQERDYSDIIAEIKSLHHSIYTEPFLKNAERYIKARSIIYTLSEYLKLNSDELKKVMSENERAYAIWHDEKLLDKDENVRLLKECRVFGILNTYPTPEPFFDYRTNSSPSCVLVIENKDTWFSLRKIMIESKSCITLFDVTIDCVLYGEGKKISQTMSSLSEYLALDNFHGKVYYWGDIDYEGIGIYQMAAQRNPDLNMLPLTSVYETMLNTFKQPLLQADVSIDCFRCRSGQKPPKDMHLFFDCFGKETVGGIEELLRNGLYIPQEIISYPFLEKLCRKEQNNDNLS